MKSSATKPDNRKASVRRDLNDLVRDDKGRMSPARIGLLIGQWLAIKLILEHGSEIIANWDSLLVLFTILVAPDVLRKVASMKYNGGSEEKHYDIRRYKSSHIKDLSRE